MERSAIIPQKFIENGEPILYEELKKGALRDKVSLSLSKARIRLNKGQK